MTTLRPVLHVCVTCKAGQACEGDEVRPGRVFHDAMADALRRGQADGEIDLRPVACLTACERGCTATILMPGKFGYILGDLSPDKADDLVAYARAYAASKTGLVLPSKRAESLRTAMIARFPPPDVPTAASDVPTAGPGG